MNQEEQSKTDLGKRLKNWRKSKGLSAYKLAKLTGVHPSFISNVEADRRPLPEDFMKKLAAIPELGISYKTLRVWKMQADYDFQEIEEAFLDASGDYLISSYESASSSTPQASYRFPIKMTFQAGVMTPHGHDPEQEYATWAGIHLSTPDEVICVRLNQELPWISVPEGALALIKESDFYEDGKSYLIEIDPEKSQFCLVQYNKATSKMVPLNAEINPFLPLRDFGIRSYQVLYTKVQWS